METETNNQCRQSPRVREELNAHIEAYLASGGKITVIEDNQQCKYVHYAAWVNETRNSILRGAKKGNLGKAGDARVKNG